MGLLDDVVDFFADVLGDVFGDSKKKKKKKKKKKRKKKRAKLLRESQEAVALGAEESLDDRIFNALADGGKTAAELSRLLGEFKSDVNRILYRHKDRHLEKIGDSPPHWSLIDGVRIEKDEIEDISLPGVPKPYDWQKKASRAWTDAGEKGVVEAVTGTGKTYLGAIALGKVLKEGGRGVVLVPTRELQDQWVAELENLGFQSVGRLGNGYKNTLGHCSVLVAVAASASIYDLELPKRTKGLLVADEVHRYAAETWKDALEEKFETRLGLTATFERQDGAHEEILLPYFEAVVFRYEYAQAIKEGIIAEFKLATIGVSFTKRERAEYEECNEEVSKAVLNLKKYHGAPDPYAGGTSFGEFMKFVTQLSKEGDRRKGMAAGKFLKFFNQRRTLLAETGAKYDALEKLAPAIKASNGTIAFTATIESAEIAADVLQRKKISCGLHHSKMNKEERRLVLEQFKNRDINAIVAPKTLDEGIDVPEADLGIIIAASREKRQMIQRMGRVLRRKKDQRLAKFAILYVKDTSEDPNNGAHGAFLEAIRPVASAEKDFGPRSTMKSISEFLK
jgi:superfamily II DNA or RNA helicase